MPRILLLLVLTPWIHAQDAQTVQDDAPPQLKRGFSTLLLGDDDSATKEKLRDNTFFRYSGDPDIDFSRRPPPMITVTGSGYIVQANLLFYQQRLYLIELNLDNQLISYDTLLASLRQRYQRPQQIDQQRVIWQNDSTRLVLSYPNVVQVIDLTAIAAMSQDRGEGRQLLQQNRETFLEQF